MTTLQDVIQFITLEAEDDDLRVVFDVSNQRRKTLRSRDASLALAALKVGDRVRLKGLSPKYLNGLVGQIVRRDNTRLVVDLDENQYTGKYGRSNLRIPASSLEAE